MHVLILGGTRFAGRAVVDAALERGDTVTLFNRGQTNPGLYPQTETIIGDRTGDLRALADRHWDAMVDVAAYDPEVVRRSVRALADAADRYVFVSTLSVYADHGIRQVEGALAAGLRLRPLAETIRDTLAWDLARGGPEPGKEGLSREREEDLLRSLADPAEGRHPR